MIHELEAFLNIQSLEDCHLEICSGISQSKTNLSSRVIPHYEMQGNQAELLKFKNSEGARIANVAEDGLGHLNDSEKEVFKGLTHEQKKKFMLLYKKAYCDGEFVRLKFTKPEFQSQKFATFQEWFPS